MPDQGRSIGPREMGMLMLGGGVLLFALVVLHFYVTEVLPHTGADKLGTYCQGWDENTVIVTVNNYGGEDIVETNVYVDDVPACHLTDIPPNSSDVCKASVEGSICVYRVVAVTSSGKKLKDAGVCVEYQATRPLPVRAD